MAEVDNNIDRAMLALERGDDFVCAKHMRMAFDELLNRVDLLEREINHIRIFGTPLHH